MRRAKDSVTAAIRDLSIADYDDLVRLWQEANLPYRPHGRDSREAIARQMEGNTSLFLGAEQDGKLVGAVLGTHDGRKGWINRLAVHPAHRRRGIGQALVCAVEARLQAMGIEIIGALIEDWNDDSMAFFARLGYVAHSDILYFSKRRSPKA
ncbi:MAG TPA: GNAT family N-acetyltransferase [Candidatus Acetothermia bacterium]|nr:GNAT family N-acetyltransferase [Candidatus Acetothermia bacterium]